MTRAVTACIASLSLNDVCVCILCGVFTNALLLTALLSPIEFTRSLANNNTNNNKQPTQTNAQEKRDHDRDKRQVPSSRLLCSLCSYVPKPITCAFAMSRCQLATRNSQLATRTRTRTQKNQTKKATCTCRSFTVAIIVGACN